MLIIKNLIFFSRKKINNENITNGNIVYDISIFPNIVLPVNLQNSINNMLETIIYSTFFLNSITNASKLSNEFPTTNQGNEHINNKYINPNQLYK